MALYIRFYLLYFLTYIFIHYHNQWHVACTKITLGMAVLLSSVADAWYSGVGVHTIIKLGSCILYGSRSACIDREVKRSEVKVTWLRKLLWSLTAVVGMQLLLCMELHVI